VPHQKLVSIYCSNLLTVKSCSCSGKRRLPRKTGTRFFGRRLQTGVIANSAPRPATCLPGPNARPEPLCYQGIQRLSPAARGGVIRRMNCKMKHSRDILSAGRQIFEIAISNPSLRSAVPAPWDALDRAAFATPCSSALEVHYRPIAEISLAGFCKTAPQAVIRRCTAFVNAHRKAAGSSKLKAERMGSFPLSFERMLPWLTARCLFFNTLLDKNSPGACNAWRMFL